MASSNDPPSPVKNKKSSQTRNDSDNPWLVIPNNLELGARVKPSKKQRNKEKHRQFQQGNLSPPSEVADSLSSKPKPSFHSFPQAKTATWVKEQYINEKKCKRRAYEIEQDYSDTDFHQCLQQNVHFPANKTFSDVKHQENQAHSLRCGVENENAKSVQGECKKKELDALNNQWNCDLRTQIQEFISEIESLWPDLNLDDSPIFKDAVLKLKNTMKSIEGGRENILLYHSAVENGCGSRISPSSSISRISNSKENTVNRDITGNSMCKEGEEQDKCNHQQKGKMEGKTAESSDETVLDEDLKFCNSDCDSCNRSNGAMEHTLRLPNDIEGRVAAIEWELRKLYYKDAANAASVSLDTQHPKTKDKRKRKQSKHQSISQSVKQKKGVPTEDIVTLDCGTNVTLDCDTPALFEPRHPHISISAKRDNVRKEQNSFPARRHYEAEGRANEEPDIPVRTAPALSPALDNVQMQQKEVARDLRVILQQINIVKDILKLKIECSDAGVDIPADQLYRRFCKKKADQYFAEEPEEGADHDKEISSAVHLSSSEPTATNLKDLYRATVKSLMVGDSCREEESEEIVADNLETTVGKKEDLTKLRSQFHQLMQILPTSDCKNDDPVRSSGEGAYTLQKLPARNVVSEHAQKKRSLRIVPHQDNLQLTRQNIATMESQSQNTNLHNRDCNSVKKDNINNLSGKMGKLSIQNSMNSSYPDVLHATNNNMDSASLFSYELNQNHSVPNEIERKNIFDILKRDKKKQKQYDRNQDNKLSCNSSVDSEPLEGSTSGLVYDSTTLGAWGGSSTQENFEDDPEEQGESTEEHEADEGEIGPSSVRHHPTTEYEQYCNMYQQYVDSLANISDKKQRNLHHPLHRNQNQSTVQSGFHQHLPQEVKTVRQRLSSASAVSGPPRDMQDNAACTNEAEHIQQQQLPSNFIQQLLSHVEQLNALCQNQIYQERPLASVNPLSSQNYGHVPNTSYIGSPPQPSLELPFPFNQQLLLCLSQCYHALYMQQLEIQHLQRCMWQTVEGENSHQQNHFNARANHEEAGFRPYCSSLWPNSFIPSSNFLPEQASPVSSGPYFHLPVKPYPNYSAGTHTNSGSQPARAVIHPTSQNNTASQETLNNQVPPRTRANNFWDNFRSYSRQNLLSTSNTVKRNENAASLIAPQVRQVYPLVTNTSLNQSTDTSNSCCISSSCSEHNRAPPNAEDTAVKHYKLKNPTAGSSKNDVPSNVNNSSSARVIRRGTPRVKPRIAPDCSSVLTQHPKGTISQQCSKSGILSMNVSNSVSCPVPEATAAAVNTTQEVTSMLSTNHKSDFLIGLLHEAQALKSETLRQKALKMIRDLAVNEEEDDDLDETLPANSPKLQIDYTDSDLEIHPITISNQHCAKNSSESIVLLPDAAENEGTSHELPSENASGSIQTLPTAAISPLSNHTMPRTVSTGAIRKKTKFTSGIQNFSESSISNVPASLHDSNSSTIDSNNPPATLPAKKNLEDIPRFVTEKVIADLTTVLPAIKRRSLRDGSIQTFWTFITDCLLDRLETHLSFYNINLSRKSLLHLRQVVCAYLSHYSGIRLSDLEILDPNFPEMFREFISENIRVYISIGQFIPLHLYLDEENSHMVNSIEDKMHELCVVMSGDSSEPNSIKMSVSTHDDPSETLNTTLPVKIKEELGESVIMKDSSLPSEENMFAPRVGSTQMQHLINTFMQENFPSETIASPPEQEHVEDLRCDCNPEAEIEPEVEIGTEADLAEADQSPGQQGPGVGETWSVPMPDREIYLSDDEYLQLPDDSQRRSSDALMDEEAILDNIPTKLCPSEEELSQHKKEEQPVQLSPVDAISQDEFTARQAAGIENNTDTRVEESDATDATLK